MYVAIGGGLRGRPENCTSRQETVVKPCLHNLLFVYFRRSREPSMVAHCYKHKAQEAEARRSTRPVWAVYQDYGGIALLLECSPSMPEAPGFLFISQKTEYGDTHRDAAFRREA